MHPCRRLWYQACGTSGRGFSAVCVLLERSSPEPAELFLLRSLSRRGFFLMSTGADAAPYRHSRVLKSLSVTPNTPCGLSAPLCITAVSDHSTQCGMLHLECTEQVPGDGISQQKHAQPCRCTESIWVPHRLGCRSRLSQDVGVQAEATALRSRSQRWGVVCGGCPPLLLFKPKTCTSHASSCKTKSRGSRSLSAELIDCPAV